MRFLCSLILTSLALAPLAAADPLSDDLKARRQRLMEQIGGESLAIFWSAEPKTYSWDVEYEYRQDSNLLYLTGIAQPETLLVLMPGNATRREILFIRAPDARREHWSGHTLTKEEATQRSGIATVHYASEFESFVSGTLNRRAYGVPRDKRQIEYKPFFDALAAARGRLALLLTPAPGLSEPLGPVHSFAAKVRERHPNVGLLDAAPLVHGLRQVKTAYEQEVLAGSVSLSAHAHVTGMRAAAPGRFEHEVESAIEAVYLAGGAMSPGYPSIVGSGYNATILHYTESSRKMEDGDLLLVDAAANYQGLTGDITRTYPINGRFTEAQKDLYRLVLEAQAAGEKAARVGNTTADVEKASADVVKKGLLKLGLITDATSEQFRTWYTHGICHWIGMDVHDVGDYERKLEPGMAFVIEPGIYIRTEALAQLSTSEADRAFAAKVKPAVDKYAGIGVRVEDSYLLTASGLKRLSTDVPRDIDAVEAEVQR